MGKITVDIALLGWVPLTLALFALMPPRRAVLFAVVGGWLFLPMARGYEFAGLPDYNKFAAALLIPFICALVFDSRSLSRVKWSWIDIPIAVWIIAPMFSSLSNGLGPRDGLSECLDHFIQWGIPYLFGRMYFTTARGVVELAVALVVAGLIYVPFCLYEIRMSPQLHNMVYGFHPHAVFGQTRRLGGWRPQVFLPHGLAVGLLMCMAALVASAMWTSGRAPKTLGLPAIVYAPVLIIVAILCKSLAAIGLTAVGVCVFFFARWTGTRLVLALLAAVPLTYAATRISGAFTGQMALDIVSQVVPQREFSLRTRFESETRMIEHAANRWVFGWGGWGRNLPTDTYGRSTVITDGQWILAFGINGVVGLVGLLGAMVLPPLVAVWRWPPSRRWRGEQRLTAACVLSLATVCLLFAVDNLLNAMPNPLFVCALGTLGGVARPALARRAAPARPSVGSDAAWRRGQRGALGAGEYS